MCSAFEAPGEQEALRLLALSILWRRGREHGSAGAAEAAPVLEACPPRSPCPATTVQKHAGTPVTDTGGGLREKQTNEEGDGSPQD